jgi:hypothetical protein
MLTNSRSRGRGLVLAVLTLVASLPELARAQQTGLFPNHAIKRQRVPCDQEDPIYKVYKHQYFGYHPTCWRTFPTGWGCPSPEAPDKAKSFKELPLAPGDTERTDEAEGEGGAMPGQPGVTRPALPPLQGGARSPFEEPTDADKPGAAPRNPRGTPAPLPTPPGDPFDLDTKPDPTVPPRTAPARPGSASNGPDLSAPAETPGPIQGTRSSRNESSEEPENGEDQLPVLALPATNLPGVNDAGAPFGTRPPAPVASAAPADGSSSTPRRGFLSGFFNNLGLNWVRR